MKTDTITKLLNSSEPSAIAFGIASLLIFFVPSVADILDNPNLSTWGRIGGVSKAAGEAIAVIVSAGLDPRVLGVESGVEINEDERKH